MTRISWSLVVGALVSAAVGCGGGTGFEKPVPVTGKVVFQGKPVDGAMVTFLSKAEGTGRSASGQTAADGSFSLTTFKTGDGALPGDYIVTVSKVERGSDTSYDPSKGAVGADYWRPDDGCRQRRRCTGQIAEGNVAHEIRQRGRIRHRPHRRQDPPQRVRDRAEMRPQP